MNPRPYVLLASLLGPACGEEECPYPTNQDLMVPADQSCPSVADAPQRIEEAGLGAFVSVDGLLASTLLEESHVICWYRAGAPTDEELRIWGTDCPVSVSRDQQLAEATGALPNDFSRYDGLEPNYLQACDDEGLLFGHVIASQSGDDACPTEVPSTVTEYGEAINPEAFVGRDVYPARVMCEYRVTAIGTCGGGGWFPSGGLM